MTGSPCDCLLFFYEIIREIYMAFYETNSKCFRKKRVLISRKRDSLYSLCEEREGCSEENKRNK